MWAKIGVDLAIDVRELAVMTNIQGIMVLSHHDLQYSGPHRRLVPGRVAPEWLAQWQQGAIPPFPRLEPDAIERLTNPAEADCIHKDLTKYVLDQAWTIPRT